jgi:hypothetical protein
MTDVGIFYGHLVYFVVILVIFSFLVCLPRKIWQPWSKLEEKSQDGSTPRAAIHRKCPLKAQKSKLQLVRHRVARWFIFKQKSQFGQILEGHTYMYMGKCSYILWPFGIFYGHLGYFMTIW